MGASDSQSRNGGNWTQMLAHERRAAGSGKGLAEGEVPVFPVEEESCTSRKREKQLPRPLPSFYSLDASTPTNRRPLSHGKRRLGSYTAGDSLRPFVTVMQGLGGQVRGRYPGTAQTLNSGRIVAKARRHHCVPWRHLHPLGRRCASHFCPPSPPLRLPPFGYFGIRPSPSLEGFHFSHHRASRKARIGAGAPRAPPPWNKAKSRRGG